MRIQGLSLLLLLSVWTAQVAAGPILYDNGTPNETGAGNLNNYTALDDFSFDSTTEIFGAEVFLTSWNDETFWNTFREDGFSEAYTYYIWEGYPPGSGAVIQSGIAQNASVTTSTIPTASDYTLLLSFDFLSSITANAGQSYWLGLTTNTTGTTTTWAQTDQQTGFVAFSHPHNSGTYYTTGDYAFRITGAASEPPTPASVPGTFALVIIGLFGIGGAGRRTFIRRNRRHLYM